MLRIPAGQRRLDILERLKDLASHFPPQRHGDPARGGVTARRVARKLSVPRSIAEPHLGLLVDLGLLRTRRIRWRTYYRHDEMRIAEVARMFEKGW
ncbi:ArsR family transcriptional regulator [Streptomyces canus]|uniref:ArsR family transcriptional regulator n=1 Tax=Streptomyces canus TaxID=58343 RepID=UPI00277D48DA|nr:ArsR family transcriptional regulator [Streptomyces canus]MDQ0758316.1 DNA-binding transcriptional ArsR family regulator [Streptomyces canus]